MIAGRFDAEIYELLANGLPARGSVVWDVGAHFGFHTLGFAAMVGPTGRVVGFEPNPSNRERLQQNLDRNADLAARIEILPCALSDRNGDSSFVLSRDIESGASSMSFLDGTTPSVDPATAGTWDKLVVPVRTADSVVRDDASRTPHVIKIDVEGAELLVLHGAAEIARTFRPTMIVEVHSAKLAFEVNRWLQAQGYEVHVLADLAPSRVLFAASFTHSSFSPPIPPSGSG